MSSRVKAETSHFAFTSPAHIVGIGEKSDPIIIEYQNNKGESEKLTDTVDINFTSTSKTGKFIGSTGKDVGKTMNKNTSHKTFYYTDATAGNYILSLTLTPRNTLQSQILSQQVIITSEKNSVIDEGPLPASLAPSTITSATSTPLTQVALTFEAQKQVGFVSKVFSLPIRILEFVRRLFVEE